MSIVLPLEWHGRLKRSAHLQVQTRIERETDVIILLRRLTTLHFATGDHHSLYRCAPIARSSSLVTLFCSVSTSLQCRDPAYTQDIKSNCPMEVCLSAIPSLPSLTMPPKTSIPSKTRGKHPRLPSLRAEQENSPSPPPEHPTKRTWNQSASARQAEEEQYEREVRAAKRKADKADDMSIVAFKT